MSFTRADDGGRRFLAPLTSWRADNGGLNLLPPLTSWRADNGRPNLLPHLISRQAQRAVPLLLVLLAGSDRAVAQTGGAWQVFLYGNEVRAVAALDEDIYAATSGGVVRYDAGGGFRQWNRGLELLQSDSVRVVARDISGKLWFGTDRSGMSVFDPEEELFRPFTSLLEPIPGDRIRRVRFSGGAGAETLLVGAEQGYAVFVEGDLRGVCLEGVDICGLTSYDVRDLLQIRDELWLATARGATVQLEEGVWVDRSAGLGGADLTVLRRADSLYAAGSRGVWTWREDHWGPATAGLPPGFEPADLMASEDSLWLAGSQGVYLRVNGVWTRVGATSFPATSLTRTLSGTLYAGAADPSEQLDGLWEWTGSDWVQHKLEGPSLRAHYRSALLDTQGDLWLSSAEQGKVPLLTRYDGENWSFFNGGSQGSLRAWTYKTLQLGQDLWLAHCCCTNPEELCRIERVRGGASFQAFDEVRNAWDFDVDPEGNLWVATTNETVTHAYGVWRYLTANSTWLNFTPTNTPMLSTQVRALRVQDRAIWLGYESQGVHRWDLGTDREPMTADDSWIYFTEADAVRPLIGDAVRRIEIASDGRVWIGTTAGISIFDGLRFTNVGAGFGRLPEAEVNALLPTRDQGAWVATRGAGLTRMTPRANGGFTYETYSAPFLPHPNVEAMVATADESILWLGTARGLARFLPARTGEEGNAEELGAYPNPFRPHCGEQIRLLGTGGQASGVVIDLSGKVLARFDDVPAGEVVWTGQSGGETVSPGLYWLRVQAPRGTRSIGVAVIDAACGP